jgi:hypothetical protein
MLETLIQKIKSLLQEIDGIASVYEYEPEKFSDTPVVVIVPSTNEDDYKTSSENLRVYAFDLRVYVNRSVAPAGQVVEEYSDRILRGVVDKVLNKLDTNYKMSGITVPAGFTFINMRVHPSSWGISGREDEYRAAEIDVRCTVNVNLDLI